MQIHSVGIDLGKTTFHLVALGAAGKLLVKKKFTEGNTSVYGQPANFTDRAGSLCRSPLSRPSLAQARSSDRRCRFSENSER